MRNLYRLAAISFSLTLIGHTYRHYKQIFTVHGQMYTNRIPANFLFGQFPSCNFCISGNSLPSFSHPDSFPPVIFQTRAIFLSGELRGRGIARVRKIMLEELSEYAKMAGEKLSGTGIVRIPHKLWARTIEETTCKCNCEFSFTYRTSCYQNRHTAGTGHLYSGASDGVEGRYVNPINNNTSQRWLNVSWCFILTKSKTIMLQDKRSPWYTVHKSNMLYTKYIFLFIINQSGV